MDLRIVNTCNNNCLYCLEQSYREKKKYLDTNTIFSMIKKQKDDKIISFYWWNPLLHPEIDEIVNYCKNNWFESIWILTNTYWLNREILNKLVENWLKTIWFYFNSFDNDSHNTIVNWWISLSELISNIELIKTSWLNYKAIIHLNNQNIKKIYKDIVLLNKKYFVNNFEFINYFPFDRPYEKFRNLLEYKYNKNRKEIDLIFITIKKLKLDARFSKFSKDFFWEYIDFYDYKTGVLNNISKEDKVRIKDKIPFCYEENRCSNCFIKDYCIIKNSWYDKTRW